MISSKVKPLFIVFALLLLTGIFTTGCGQKAKSSWVNTNSMPGKTFSRYFNGEQHTSSNIVFLGQKDSTSSVNFGPRNVNFEFKNLK